MASILEQAALDVAAILQDTTGGGLSIQIRDPNGDTETIVGWAADIGLRIDNETGQSVTGRTVQVSLPTAALTLGIPRGQLDESSRPWTMRFQLPARSTAETYRITETMPDQIGCLVCFLEPYDSLYDPSP